jgi:hypothetical protein
LAFIFKKENNTRIRQTINKSKMVLLGGNVAERYLRALLEPVRKVKGYYRV